MARSSGAMPRPSSSTSTCSSPSSRASMTHGLAGAGMARDVGERLLHARGRPRSTRALDEALEAVPSGMRISQLTPERLREVLHQPLGGVGEAEVVEHQRPQVGRDAPRRGHRLVEQRPISLGAWRRARVARGRCSRSQARSILSAVSSWPSSSCSSRAMRVFSSSRASSTRAESSRSSCCWRLQRVLGLLAQRDVAQDHRVEAPARPRRLRDRGLDRELARRRRAAPTAWSRRPCAGW